MIEDKKDGIGEGDVVGNSKGESWMGDGIGLNEVGGLKEGCEWVNKVYGKDKRS